MYVQIYIEHVQYTSLYMHTYHILCVCERCVINVRFGKLKEEVWTYFPTANARERGNAGTLAKWPKMVDIYILWASK